jgi:hypothetical protein
MDPMKDLRTTVTIYYEENKSHIRIRHQNDKMYLLNLSSILHLEFLSMLNKKIKENVKDLTLEEIITQDALFAAIDILGKEIIYHMLEEKTRGKTRVWTSFWNNCCTNILYKKHKMNKILDN